MTNSITDTPTLRMRRRQNTAEASTDDVENGLPAWLEAPTRPLDPEEPDTVVRPRPARIRQDVDLALYAALLAGMHCRPSRTTEVLDGEGVSTALWRRASARWEQVLMLGARIGDDALLDRFDEAYVASLGVERGRVVDVATYALLEVASEADRLATTLAREGLPREAAHVIQRYWYRRMLESDEVLRRATISLLRVREQALCTQ